MAAGRERERTMSSLGLRRVNVNQTVASGVSAAPSTVAAAEVAASTRRPMPFETLAMGAGIQIFEVATVGQPFEVVKTHLAAYRNDSLMGAVRATYSRGGIAGFYQVRGDA